MLVKRRLQINAVLSVLTALIITAVFSVALYRISEANSLGVTAGEIVTSALERSILGPDYVRNDGARAKDQWFAKHEQIGGLLATARTKFRDAGDRAGIDELIANHEAIGKIFSAIVRNREGNNLSPGSVDLAVMVEGSLINQLSMREYDAVTQARMLLASSSKARISAIRQAVGSVIALLFVAIAAAVIMSRSTGRAIADRVGRLRDGVLVMGTGNLGHRIDVRGDDEFAELSGAFNEMAAKLCGLYNDLEREIGERRQAEDSLRESETRYRNLFTNMTEEVHFWKVLRDEQGRIVTWALVDANPPALKSWGHQTVDEVRGKTTDEIFGPGAVEHYLPIVEKIAKEGAPYSFEDYFPNLDKYFRFTSIPLGDYFITTGADITDIKKAQLWLEETNVELEKRVTERTAEVEKERRRLFEVLETLPVMICLLTPDYHVAFANRSFREKFGEPGGRHCYDTCFGHTEPCKFCESFRVLETGQPHRWEVTSPDGSMVIDVYDFPFTDVDGSPLILEMDIDITDRRRAERALQELNEKLEQRVAERTAEMEQANVLLKNSRLAALNMMEDAVAARQQAEEASRKREVMNKELESFIYAISHDLRTPLRSISTFAQFLSQDPENHLSETGGDHLDRIKKNAVKMSVLVEDILNLSKISRLEVERQKIDMSEMARSIISDLRESAPERNVEIEIREDVTAFADPRLLESALANLLGNAWKFTAGKEDARIIFGTTEEKGQTVYFVKDNGAGFDPAYATRMFAPFQRLHTDAAFEGTGIGLAIVERAVQRHGGMVWAVGEPNKGATFFFTL